jgi:hypothetical protein
MDDVEKIRLLTLPELELRPLGRPARSQSLYRLSYPGSSLSGLVSEKVISFRIDSNQRGSDRSLSAKFWRGGILGNLQDSLHYDQDSTWASPEQKLKALSLRNTSSLPYYTIPAFYPEGLNKALKFT